MKLRRIFAAISICSTLGTLALGCDDHLIIVNEPRKKPKPVASADKPTEELPHAEVGALVPAVSLIRFRSEEDVELYRMRGGVTVVYFFASWSKPSVAGLEPYRDLANHLSNRKVSMIAVAEDADESMDRVQLVIDQNAPDVMVALDRDHKLGLAFGVEDLPAVAVIDPDGIVRFLRTTPKGKDDLKDVEASILSVLKTARL